ncbi:patatin-like phospholipase family protein [Bradyrhizobium mercantei]|uniref:patatin-like phospholipase family protein n=1 Tax=Bradyrhizobium mercantei TaxID=1904807 RepID=UPI0024BF3FA9|nr:patatin-like phospholipase family protein [Bradyrhizobium mercantei]
MDVQGQLYFGNANQRLPFECVALVLQGGGALGAYQAGLYEALDEAKIDPDWVAGVSIGAINSAIIPTGLDHPGQVLAEPDMI